MSRHRVSPFALHLLRFFFFALGVVGSLPCAAETRDDLKNTYVPQLEKNLTANILAFWHPESLDRTNGGYHMSFDAEGKLQPGGTKMIVTQARMVWLFARAARAGYGAEYLAAAEHGYRFLTGKMWDEKHGGFYWEVDAAGEKVVQPKKHLYGQAFALYALSEYALASNKPEVKSFATRLFRLLEEKAHDKTYGGYREAFHADWSVPPPEEATSMGVPSQMKLMNTHLHLMEAMTAFYRANPLPLARERLLELITIQSNTVVRKTVGACTDRYERDWTPILEGAGATVSYGHDLENIWLLVDAADAAGIPNAPLLDLYRTLFEYSLKYGYDRRMGGFYESGGFHREAEKREKTWWVQAEALVSALYMYRLTGEQKYRVVFDETLNFIDRYQTDWKHGEWHPTVTPDGKGTGAKAHNWKAGYHNGRAMIECIALLNQWKMADAAPKK